MNSEPTTRPAEDDDGSRPELLGPGKSPVMGRRAMAAVPTRGLQGVAVIAGSLAVVAGVVIGGVAAVSTVAGSGGQEPQNASLAASNVQSTAAPISSATASDTTATPTATPTVRKRRTATQDAVPVRTRTVTETAAPTGTATAKKQSSAAKKKASTAAKKAEASPNTTVQWVGMVKNEMVADRCIDLAGVDGVALGTKPVSLVCYPGSTDNQEYETIAQANGSFLLRNVKSHYCLDVPGRGADASGTEIGISDCLIGAQDNQMFKKQAQGNGFYLVNVKSGLCLDISNEGGNDKLEQVLTLFPCSPTDDHIWNFVTS
ncbi:RICIN domain-containing protein [Kineosporia sp. NBRC 101731]|uniref:RICIN domain-containing protein n=1 Tax=Kineosporia sp. NBRC 101731 TaxID=3032199 RepID=UPI0024A3F0DB|nr:RICIN domain-containing protein [Kineosporia sp. NBRC 101731]GLY33779.1 hypothetical protein Kisp02_71440 [Kineosporia sp. NBRC 101731]